jgi:L,D-peptidoglycan transpeptidase YkuD (ErfK/YbiS/YcfS/YnhG family)
LAKNSLLCLTHNSYSSFAILFLSLLFLSGCTPITPKSLQALDQSISQAIIVHPVPKNSNQAQLSAWQRQGIAWHRVYCVSAVIGRKGLAAAGEKKEGDGKTPSGTFALGPAFGYASSMDTGLPYRQATDNDFWVDDVRSLQYNQWVSGRPSAISFERMKRQDGLYQYGIVIGYNIDPVIPGAGSAIFMHVWRGYNSPTAGCVAINQRYLRKVLRWLSRQYQPVIILE